MRTISKTTEIVLSHCFAVANRTGEHSEAPGIEIMESLNDLPIEQLRAYCEEHGFAAYEFDDKYTSGEESKLKSGWYIYEAGTADYWGHREEDYPEMSEREALVNTLTAHLMGDFDWDAKNPLPDPWRERWQYGQNTGLVPPYGMTVGDAIKTLLDMCMSEESGYPDMTTPLCIAPASESFTVRELMVTGFKLCWDGSGPGGAHVVIEPHDDEPSYG